MLSGIIGFGVFAYSIKSKADNIIDSAFDQMDNMQNGAFDQMDNMQNDVLDNMNKVYNGDIIMVRDFSGNCAPYINPKLDIFIEDDIDIAHDVQIREESNTLKDKYNTNKRSL